MSSCNFVKDRDYDPDCERVEKKKLQKQVKHEAKGAAHELRKDAFFLLEVKEKKEHYGKKKEQSSMRRH